MQVEVSFTVELRASADVNEAEAQVLEAGRAAMVEAVGLVCRECEGQVETCPACGERALSSEGRVWRVLLTGFGRVVLHLRRLRCEGCGGRFRPAQRFIECLGGANVTGKLRSACALAGASWPYQTAARLLGELCGAQVSKETLRQLTVGAGAHEAERQTQEATRVHSATPRSVRGKESQPVPRVPEILIVGLDGGWVPSCDQPGGMEGKVAVVATQTTPVGLLGRRRLSVRRLAATFGSSSRLGVLACAECIALRGHEAQRQAVLGDGANWIKTQARQHFGGGGEDPRLAPRLAGGGQGGQGGASGQAAQGRPQGVIRESARSVVARPGR